MDSIETELNNKLNDFDYAKIYGAERTKIDFGITLMKARKHLAMTQKELAEKLGVSQPYVSKLEKGEANPTVGAFGSLLAIIGLRLKTDLISLKSTSSACISPSPARPPYTAFHDFISSELDGIPSASFDATAGIISREGIRVA